MREARPGGSALGEGPAWGCSASSRELGVVLCVRGMREGRRMEGKRKGKGEKEKKRGERERERHGGIRGGDRGVGRVRMAVERYAVRHVERGKGAAIDFGVGRRKRREGFRGIGISDGRRI